MPATCRIVAVSPGSALLAPAAALFDDYRVHYGHPADPDGTVAWLARQLTGAFRMFVALRDTPAGQPLGLISVVELPASLRLGTFWSVRDLYVAAAHRRGGVARALLGHAVAGARAAGALRVSLQTEPGNTSAQALYAAAGFRPVPDLDLLSLPLTTGL
ncbi:GNAT family N-acetyltransferase [Actinoplanes sp. NEAU-A12]|uniref:GNAT family N-acetyltransferase n=1 Tax=Actinoplanes sandaracinus TaxID=3045177 RepID=A0ABT6WFD1_9ACTN|nr:GNAT family N-acetyltransferase [Actinoplanes sandaracinus]MDI6098388.1 GNAT family N-acetyltransferase [Actinoplanes sandaracinus]